MVVGYPIDFGEILHFKNDTTYVILRLNPNAEDEDTRVSKQPQLPLFALETFARQTPVIINLRDLQVRR